MSAALSLISRKVDYFNLEVDPELTARMALDRELFASLACYFFAEDAYVKLETGIALAYCHLARVSVMHIYYKRLHHDMLAPYLQDKLAYQRASRFDINQPGLPDLSRKGRAHFLPGIENYLAKIVQFDQKVDRDNRLIAVFTRLPNI